MEALTPASRDSLPGYARRQESIGAGRRGSALGYFTVAVSVGCLV
jgi:hypothetical protein